MISNSKSYVYMEHAMSNFHYPDSLYFSSCDVSMQMLGAVIGKTNKDNNYLRHLPPLVVGSLWRLMTRGMLTWS